MNNPIEKLTITAGRVAPLWPNLTYSVHFSPLIEWVVGGGGGAHAGGFGREKKRKKKPDSSPYDEMQAGWLLAL